jgi:hypothetical protein
VTKTKTVTKTVTKTKGAKRPTAKRTKRPAAKRTKRPARKKTGTARTVRTTTEGPIFRLAYAIAAFQARRRHGPTATVERAWIINPKETE